MCTVVQKYDSHNRTPTFRLQQVPEGETKVVEGYTQDTKKYSFLQTSLACRIYRIKIWR